MKFNMTLGVVRRYAPFTVTLTGRAQSSFGNPVFNSEQLTLDGPEALSGLPPGRYAVDEGGTLRGEVGLDKPWAPGAAITPYAYVSAGAGRLHGTTAVEASTLRSSGAGLGARLRF